MLPKQTTTTSKKRSIKSKPKLIRCGKHFINPEEVAAIREAKTGLYIVDLKSKPNPEYPLWVIEKDIAPLIDHFEVIEGEDDPN